MIVVLDTNVIISALLSPGGNSAEIIRRWEAEEFDVVSSPVLIGEIRQTLNYERVKKYLKLSSQEIDSFLARFQAITINVGPENQLDVIKDDPDDNRVLECALEARAVYIVSGDHHLLQLKEYQGIVILPPAGFLTLLKFEK